MMYDPFVKKNKYGLDDYFLIRDELKKLTGQHYTYGTVQAMISTGRLTYKVTRRLPSGAPEKVEVALHK